MVTEGLRRGGMHPGNQGLTLTPETALRAPEVQRNLLQIQSTYEILSRVRKPSVYERKSLTDRGFIFWPIKERTLVEVVGKHSEHFYPYGLEYIDHMLYPGLRTYVPKPMEVAFSPELYIPGSFGQTQARQLEMAEENSTNLEKEFPGARAFIPPATVTAQADIACLENTGEVLFKNRFVSTLESTAGSDVVFVGRNHPDDKLAVGLWLRADGHFLVGAPLAIVFVNDRESLYWDKYV